MVEAREKLGKACTTRSGTKQFFLSPARLSDSLGEYASSLHFNSVRRGPAWMCLALVERSRRVERREKLRSQRGLQVQQKYADKQKASRWIISLSIRAYEHSVSSEYRVACIWVELSHKQASIAVSMSCSVHVCLLALLLSNTDNWDRTRRTRR